MLECGGQQAVREVLIADRAQETQDSRGADRGGSRVGGGREWASVDHRITHLNTGGPAVDQQASGFAFQSRQQGPGTFQVCVIQLQGDGQLAFQMLEDLADLFSIGALHDQRRGPEYLGLQRRIGDKVPGPGDKQVGLALVGRIAFQACCGFLRAAQFVQRADASFISLENPGSEHGLRRAALYQCGSGVDETIQGGALAGNDQSRVGAKLASPLSQGGHEALCQRLTASLQGRGEE